jgi:hypothetical protein
LKIGRTEGVNGIEELVADRWVSGQILSIELRK